jgi:eukaryotic-like serine/threonine-protein kinase
MDITAGSQVGLYTIQGQVGAGGMGTVYRATDTKLGREVAIKVLPPHLAEAPESLARFEREARMLAALNHPNIATIYGFERSGDVHYLVMELVPGETLAERIARGPVPLAEALPICVQILEALEAAQVKGIVHRDLKPANIKLTSEGRVKVLDFGLAKALEPEHPAPDSTQANTITIASDPTRVGQVVGTPLYMSPEQIRGQTVDCRTDVWSFGCVLFELLSGQRPFSGQTTSDIMAHVLTQEPDWKALPSRVPQRVRDVLRKCLEKDANLRSCDPALIRREIESALASPQAGRRRGKAVAFAAVAVVVLVAIAAWFTVGGLKNRVMGAAASKQIRSIAVLPLSNDSNDPSQDYFANGFTDALITDLSKLGALKVISRTSAMQYKGSKETTRQIAKELGVDAIVEGAVTRENGRVRISARLTQAASETVLWAETYERDLRDVLSLQGDVARQIAAGVRLTLTPDEQTRLAGHPVDPEVHDLFLKAQYSLDQDNVADRKRAIDLFQQVVQKDAGFAPAYAGLALGYGGLGRFYEEPHKVMPLARQAALKAISLDPTLSEAYTALATVKLQYDWDWDGAEQDLKKAIQLNHSSGDAHDLYSAYYTALGDFKDALAEVQLARDVDPLSLRFADRFLYVLVFFKDYDRAIAEAQAMLAKNPDFVMGYAWKAMALTMEGRFPEALESQKRANALDPNPGMQSFLAVVEASAGNRAEAEKLVHNIEKVAKQQYVCNYEVSQVYAALGDRDNAMKWLKTGVEQQCDCMIWLRGEPWMEPLRADSRYLDLIKRVGLDRMPNPAAR